MFCSHCGKEVTVGAKFCPNCGAAIESQPAPVGEQQKAPTVERTGSPGGNGTEGSGQPGKGKKGVSKPLVIVAAALVLFIGVGAVLNLFGNDGKTNLNPDKSQTPQEEIIPYREFNAEEFLSGDILSGAVMYIGSDKGGESTTVGNAVMIEYTSDVFDKNFSDVIKNNEAGWETIKKCLESDWFNSESKCVELDYISEVQWKNKSYDYFRLNVIDLSTLSSKFEFSPDWTNDKEIYMIAEVSEISDSWVDELQEQIQLFNIQFYIHQFDEKTVPAPSQTTNSANETTVNSTGKVLVETEYYTIEIPPEWETYCSCEQLPGAGEHFLTFTVKDKYLEEHSDNILFELAAIPGPEFFPSYYNNEQYSYICKICKNETFMLNLMHRLSDDIQVKEQYQDLLATLQEFIPYVVQSIEEKDGFTLSYEPIEVDDGIPYVDTWIEILDTTFEQKSTVTPLGNDRVIVPHFYVNDVDGVTYYENHWISDPDLFYGVRDGLVVAFIGWVDDFPEVRTMLSADFDGIEPKTIIHDQNKYLMWKANNGYVVFEVGHSGRGYLLDMVMYVSFFADKEMCSLLTEN